MTEPKHHRYGDRETREDSVDDDCAALIASLSSKLKAALKRAEMLADSIAKARAEGKAEGVREAMDVARKGFPVLGSRGTLIDYQLVLDHAEQAHKNHYQSVERLAQRGGLCWAELYAVLHDKPFAKMDQNDAIVACRVIEARYLEALIPADTPDKVTVPEWQPIATAPIMEAVLIRGGDVRYPVVASWSGLPDAGWWLDAQGAIEGNNAVAFYPKQWMSLDAIAGGRDD